MYNIDDDMSNYNKVKDLVIDKLVAEGELREDIADEIKDRIQVLIYKGKWYKRWFEKNVKKKDGDEEGWYMKIIDIYPKQPDFKDIVHRPEKYKNDD